MITEEEGFVTSRIELKEARIRASALTLVSDQGRSTSFLAAEVLNFVSDFVFGVSGLQD